MIVSFDLDDTLFVSESKFKTEPQLKFPWNHIYRERLRLGTVALMKYIRQKNIQLWIYTTSYRSERYIRGLFRHYGIRLDQVINGKRHAEEVQAGREEEMPSIYKIKYRIDLHIDDDISFYQNGKIYVFRVFIMRGQDDDWTDQIKREIEKIKNKISPE